MGTTTLNTMLPEFARTIGAWIGSFSTTTDITTDTNVVSTGLRDTGFTDDDVLNDTFIRITGTNNSGVIRRVSDYTGSTGTIAVSGTNLSAESSSVTFELYRYDPTQLIDALNDARQRDFPALYRVITDRSLTIAGSQRRYARPTSIQPRYVRSLWLEERLGAKRFGDNIISSLDCDFEGDLTDWTTSSATLAAEADTNSPGNFMVFAGSQSGKVTVTNGNTGAILATVPSGTNYEGEEINFSIWVYTLSSSGVTAAIQFDSDTIETGTAHGGGGWERLTVSASEQSIATSIKVGVQIANTSGDDIVAYADEAIAVAGPSESPRPAGDPVLTWREEADEIVLPFAAEVDRSLLVLGMGLLSSVSSGTDTMEIDGQQTRRLYAVAAEQYFQQFIDQIEDTSQTQALRTWRHFKNRVDEGFGAMQPLTVRKTPV